jgi:hypothetical protein
MEVLLFARQCLKTGASPATLSRGASRRYEQDAFVRYFGTSFCFLYFASSNLFNVFTPRHSILYFNELVKVLSYHINGFFRRTMIAGLALSVNCRGMVSH